MKRLVHKLIFLSKNEFLFLGRTCWC